jgi:DNA-binding NarL/FixJ family response regulator
MKRGEVHAARDVALEDGIADVAAPHRQTLAVALLEAAATHGGPARVAGEDAPARLHLVVEVDDQFARIARPAPPDEPDELTAREHEVFRLIALGLSNAEIAQELYISEGSVKTHVTHVLQKLNLRDRVQAVVLAYRTGLVDTTA